MIRTEVRFPGQEFSIVRIDPRPGMIAIRLSGSVRMAWKVVQPAMSEDGGPGDDDEGWRL
jgi:hypothetical protein